MSRVRALTRRETHEQLELILVAKSGRRVLQPRYLHSQARRRSALVADHFADHVAAAQVRTEATHLAEEDSRIVVRQSLAGWFAFVRFAIE